MPIAAKNPDADEMKYPMSASAWVRHGWLAVTLLLAIALLVHAIVSYAGALSVVRGLDRGQADLFATALWERLAVRRTESDATTLARFLREYDARGLRYVAIVSASPQQSASAGRALGDGPPPAQDRASGRIPMMTVAGRLRAYFPTPLSAAADPQPRYVVLEFEPRAAVRLMRNARRTLSLATTIAVVFSIVAVIFVRTSARYQEARLRLEQQHHLTQLGEMSAVLAHEIRNPLASLKGHAQLAIEGLADGTRERRCIEYVIDSADRLEGLTSDLLSFARTGPLDVSPTDPVELVRMAGRDVFGDDRLVIDAPNAAATWPVDAARVRQVLVNLIDNARQASPARPPLALVSTQGNRLAVEIRDFGAGLPAGKEHRIFDAFFTTRASGTGLGLAVASRVAELHGGTLRATNHPDGGAVFTLTIPRQRG
jgi:two-component system sensor histidine kinase HydH